MILAEVKVDDESPKEWKLFDLSYTQFHKLVNKKFVALYRNVELESGELIKLLVWKIFHEIVSVEVVHFIHKSENDAYCGARGAPMKLSMKRRKVTCVNCLEKMYKED